MKQPAAPAGTVSSYTLRTTKVVFDDGTEVRFLELMPARAALAQAEAQRERAAEWREEAGVYVELTPLRRLMVAAGDLLRESPRLARALEEVSREEMRAGA